MAVSYERLLELQALYEQLKIRVLQIDDKYSLDYVEPELDMPDSLNLQKLEYTPKTEEELTALAEQAVAATIISKQNSAERTYLAKLKSLSLKQDKLNVKTQQTISDRADEYAKKREEIHQKLVNNGLYFSTVGNKYYNLANQEYIQDVNKLTAEGEAERDFINREITDAEALYNETLASLEEEKQARIADKLQKLIEAEEKLRISIEKYNNSLEEKEQKYQASRAKAYENARKNAYNRAYNNAKLYLEMGETGYRQLIQKEKYAVCQDAFYALRREEANTILQFDSFLLSHLGIYYDTFVEWINLTLLP